MTKPMKTLAALALAALAPLLPAAELQPFSAEYVVTWKGVTAGRSQLELRRADEGRWTYESRNTARGLFRLAIPGSILQRSTFRIADGRIVPEHFFGDDGTDSRAKDVDVRFDWNALRATGTAEERKVDLPIAQGLQDGMSVQAAMMNELLHGHVPERFEMLDKDQVKDYLYTREGEEHLKTQVGEQATQVFRIRRPDSERATWFWCAPELGYLPVKVERRNGTKVEWSMAIQKVDRS